MNNKRFVFVTGIIIGACITALISHYSNKSFEEFEEKYNSAIQLCYKHESYPEYIDRFTVVCENGIEIRKVTGHLEKYKLGNMK